ncbi:hypothetical protein F2P81_008469 [Scophthalmus maximus]|uniref:Uncharacterized protein n=1 Tax=Scophthalmus maximus TaxID=52904 RepID=A0A6A4TAQ3_SCOMX|nr:hypothetical protein F2P81_008469 [Scophthalmus maximus]
MSVLTRSRELPPFSVEPEFGTIEPGSTQDVSVRFSPLEAAQLQGRMLCRLSSSDSLLLLNKYPETLKKVSSSTRKGIDRQRRLLDIVWRHMPRGKSSRRSQAALRRMVERQ